MVDKKPANEEVTASLLAWPEREPDFEHHRVLTAARRALFSGDQVRPTMIGRYCIERRLGAGGMGEVYLGIDPELRRKVAVKLVLPRLKSGGGSERLRREAQALARLSHPNVVQVYEVGEHQGRTFFAMELVEGGTLRDWLDARPRRWPEILERFVAAGRGLAAAHGVGIVHRDFKPENVPMTSQGRVCVADFGLAQTEEWGAAAVTEDASMLYASELQSATGAVHGTLRYMPLEQLRGEIVDARADQFAFCVALYEALWGRAPFFGQTVAARRRALERAAATRPRWWPAPRRLWRVIRRGLGPAPDQRWPDMNALVAALEAIPRRRRRLVVASGVLLASGPLLATGLAPESAGSRADPCAEVEEVLRPDWSPSHRQRLVEGYEASGLRFAEATAATVASTMDDWSARWTEQSRELCWADVEARVPALQIGARGACLERQRQQLAMTSAVLLEADVGVITRAWELVTALPAPALCRDPQVEWSKLYPPAEVAEVADRAANLRQLLARSQALRLAGRPTAAREFARSALERAQALGYRPVIAEALNERGEVAFVTDRAAAGVRDLERAVDEAEASHHDHLAARIWLELAARGAHDLRDVARSEGWLRRAAAAHRRVGGSATDRARLELVRGSLADLKRDLPGAESAIRSALATLNGDPGLAASLMRSGTLARLASVVAERGRLDDALRLRRQALASAQADLGPQHPLLAEHAFALAQALLQRGPSPEAVERLEQAARLWLEGDDQPESALGVALLAQAQLRLEAGDPLRARSLAEDAQRVLQRSLPPTHPHHVNASMALAVIADQLGEPQAALDAFERAIGQLDRGIEPVDLTRLLLLANAGTVLLALRRWPEAGARFEAALEPARPGPHVPIAHLGLAVLGLRGGSPTVARAHLDALERMQAGLDPGDRLEFELLRTLSWLRQGRHSGLRPEVHAALRDEDHPHHHRMQTLCDHVGLTATDRRGLGLES